MLGARFDHAVALTRQLHASQRRKGTEIPYVSHLLGVASLVLEDGGDEDEASLHCCTMQLRTKGESVR